MGAMATLKHPTVRSDEGCTEGGARPREGHWRARLVGSRVPDVELGLVPSGVLGLADVARSGPLVLLFYGAGEDSRRDADTLRVLRWCQRCRELAARGYRVVAVSAQSVRAQSAQVQGVLAAREDAGCLFASDPALALARELGLPTVRASERWAFGRLTLLVREGRVARVWFPVDPVRDAANVSDWIRHADA